MRVRLFLIIFILSFLPFLNAITTKQKAIVINTTKSQVANLIEEFVVASGFSFQHIDPQKGFYSIYVGTTGGGYYSSTNTSGSAYPTSSDYSTYSYSGQSTTTHTKMPTFKWNFSVIINESGNNINLNGRSHGGFFPGRYFKALVRFIKNSGYRIYTNKDIAKANKLNQSGKKLIQKGEIEKAIEKYQSAIRRYSENPHYYYNLGIAYNKLDKKLLAKENFQIAVNKDPTYVDIIKNGSLGEYIPDRQQATRGTLSVNSEIKSLDLNHKPAKESLTSLNKENNNDNNSFQTFDDSYNPSDYSDISSSVLYELLNMHLSDEKKAEINNELQRRRLNLSINYDNSQTSTSSNDNQKNSNSTKVCISKLVTMIEGYDELFFGTVKNDFTGEAFIEAKSEKTGITCTGKSFITSLGETGEIAGQKGAAQLDCSNGSKLNAEWEAESASSGNGFGLDQDGNPFKFYFGTNELEFNYKTKKYREEIENNKT